MEKHPHPTATLYLSTTSQIKPPISSNQNKSVTWNVNWEEIFGKERRGVAQVFVNLKTLNKV